MVMVMMNDASRVVSQSITRECTSHSEETHWGIARNLRAMDQGQLFTVLDQCQRMTPLERTLAENVILKMIASNHVKFHSSREFSPSEPVVLAIKLLPLAMEITRSFYCPDQTVEALSDPSLSSHVVQSVSVFLNKQVYAQSSIWKDTDLLWGRFLLETYSGFVGQSHEEIRWFGENALQIATFASQLEASNSITREFCESLLTTTKPLLNGIL